MEVPIHSRNVAGGQADFVDLADLPDQERRAWLAQADLDGLAPGTHDDAAHAAYLEAAPSMREAASRKAEIARFLLTDGRDWTWPARIKEAKARFGAKGTSLPSLRRILRTVEGVDPINFAPALLAGYNPTSQRAEITPEAWQFFVETIRRAASTFPLRAAWRDVRDVAIRRDWAWPSYPTVHRCWQALDEADRRALRHGREDAVRSLTLPIVRDKTSIAALDWVSLDGRTLDFWVDWGDGRAVRPTMLALVDVASNKVLDYELTRSENATDTVRLVKRTCQTFGIFDRLYTDNGSAFAGHLVAGGAPHRFRNSGRGPAVVPLGICRHLGIELRFALPRNAQAKIAERTFAALSRSVDDPPEFAGAHAGHSPGAAPSSSVAPVPISLAAEVIRREVERHNREPGRRSQGAAGRSYEAVFNAGLNTRLTRVPTARQLYLSGLTYHPVAVDRNGRATVGGHVYGGPDTQSAMLRHHGGGKRILLAVDPDDFTAPAIAFDGDGRLICEDVECVQRGAYGSADGARIAARNRKAARDAVAAAERANETLSDYEIQALWADLTPEPETVSAPKRRVVSGQFGGAVQATADIRPDPKMTPEDVVPAQGPTPEMLANMERALGMYPVKSRNGSA